MSFRRELGTFDATMVVVGGIIRASRSSTIPAWYRGAKELDIRSGCFARTGAPL